MSEFRIAAALSLMTLLLVACNNSGSDVGKGYNNSQPASGAENGLTPGGSETGVSPSGTAPAMNGSTGAEKR